MRGAGSIGRNNIRSAPFADALERFDHLRSFHDHDKTGQIDLDNLGFHHAEHVDFAHCDRGEDLAADSERGNHTHEGLRVSTRDDVVRLMNQTVEFFGEPTFPEIEGSEEQHAAPELLGSPVNVLEAVALPVRAGDVVVDVVAGEGEDGLIGRGI